MGQWKRLCGGLAWVSLGVTLAACNAAGGAGGGAQVKSVFELVDVITQNGRFSHCMASNLMRYALSDDSLLPSEDCGVVELNERFRAGDQSFASLLREVAVAPTTTMRVAQ